jgi:hypothetical protein
VIFNECFHDVCFLGDTTKTSIIIFRAAYCSIERNVKLSELRSSRMSRETGLTGKFPSVHHPGLNAVSAIPQCQAVPRVRPMAENAPRRFWRSSRSTPCIWVQISPLSIEHSVLILFVRRRPKSKSKKATDPKLAHLPHFILRPHFPEPLLVDSTVGFKAWNPWM